MVAGARRLTVGKVVSAESLQKGLTKARLFMNTLGAGSSVGHADDPREEQGREELRQLSRGPVLVLVLAFHSFQVGLGGAFGCIIDWPPGGTALITSDCGQMRSFAQRWVTWTCCSRFTCHINRETFARTGRGLNLAHQLANASTIAPTKRRSHALALTSRRLHVNLAHQTQTIPGQEVLRHQGRTRDRRHALRVRRCARKEGSEKSQRKAVRNTRERQRN